MVDQFIVLYVPWLDLLGEGPSFLIIFLSYIWRGHLRICSLWRSSSVLNSFLVYGSLEAKEIFKVLSRLLVSLAVQLSHQYYWLLINLIPVSFICQLLYPLFFSWHISVLISSTCTHQAGWENRTYIPSSWAISSNLKYLLSDILIHSETLKMCMTDYAWLDPCRQDWF